MMYNRQQYRKLRERKVLHKKGKNWIVMSLALLGMIGAGTMSMPANADTVSANNTPQTHATLSSNSQNNQQSQHTPVTNTQTTPHTAQQPAANNNNNESQERMNININHVASNIANQRPVQTPNINRQVHNNQPAVHQANNNVQQHNAAINNQTQHHVQEPQAQGRINNQQAANNARGTIVRPQRRNIEHANVLYNGKRTLGHVYQQNQNTAGQPISRHVNEKAFDQSHPNVSNQAQNNINSSANAQAHRRAVQVFSNVTKMSNQVRRAVSGSNSQIPSLSDMKKLSNSVNTLSQDQSNMSVESSQSSTSSSAESSSVGSLHKVLNSNAWGSAPSSAKLNGSSQEASLNSVLSTNSWASMSQSAMSSNYSELNSATINSQQLGATSSEEMTPNEPNVGYIPYSANPDNISGVVSNATSDEQEARAIAATKGGYYAPSYANQAQQYLSSLNAIVGDYNALLSGADYWKALGNSSEASTVASELASGNLATDHDDIMGYASGIAADDSLENNMIANPNTEDSIQFIYNNQIVGNTSINGKKGTETTISANIPANYRLANDGTQYITFSGGTHRVDVLPVEDTDHINYIYNGKTIGTTTMQGMNNAHVTADGTNMPVGYRLAGDSTDTFIFDNSTHNVDVIPITVPRQSTITVVFTDQAGNHMSKNVTGTSGQHGNDITQLVTPPTGYTLNAGQNTSYTFQDNPTTINLQVMGIEQHYIVNVKVNRFNKSGELVGSDTTTTSVVGRTGDKYTIDPNQFTPAGYQSESNPMSGSINQSGISNNTASFNYDQENSSPITVLYIDQNGNQVTHNVLNGLYGQTGHITTAPTGYSIKPGSDTGYTFTSSPQTIQVDVEGNSAATLPDNGEVRVMVEKMADGRILNDTPQWIPIHGLIGDHFTLYPSKMAPAGFTSVSSPVSGYVAPNGLSVDNAKFIYVSDNSSTIAVNYINQLGNNVGKGFLTGMAGNYINVTDPRQGGISVPNEYTLNNGQSTIYQFHKGVQVVNLHVIGGDNANYDFTIHAVLRRPDGNGGWTTAGMFSKNITVPESGVVGNEFSVDPEDQQITQQIPNFSHNFVPDSQDQSISGTFDNGHLSQNNGTYYYNLVAGAQGAPVTVHYINNGQTVDTQNFNGAPNQYVNLLSRVPSNYEPVNAGDYDSVMIGTKPQTVNIDLNANDGSNNNNNGGNVVPNNNVVPNTPNSVPSNNNNIPANNNNGNNNASNSASTNSNNNNVTPNNSNNNPVPNNGNNSEPSNSNTNSNGTVTINYTNANTGLVIKPMTVSGSNGSLVDLGFYKSLVPDGYYVQSIPEPVGAFTNTNQVMRINVLPIGTAYSDGATNPPVVPSNSLNTPTSSSANSNNVVPPSSANSSNNIVPPSSANNSSNNNMNSGSNNVLIPQSNNGSDSASSASGNNIHSNSAASNSAHNASNNSASSASAKTNQNNSATNYVKSVDNAMNGIANEAINDADSSITIPRANVTAPKSAKMSDAKRNYLDGRDDALSVAEYGGEAFAKSRANRLKPLVSRSYIRGYRAALGMPNPRRRKRSAKRKATRKSAKRTKRAAVRATRRYGKRRVGRSRKARRRAKYAPVRRTTTKKSRARKSRKARRATAKPRTSRKKRSKAPRTVTYGHTYGKGYSGGISDARAFHNKYNDKGANRNSHLIRYNVSRPYLNGYLTELNEDSGGKYPSQHSWGKGFLDGMIYTGKNKNLYGGQQGAIKTLKSSPNRKYKNYVRGFGYALNMKNPLSYKANGSSQQPKKNSASNSKQKDQGVPNIAQQNSQIINTKAWDQGNAAFNKYASNHNMSQANKQSRTIRYKVPKAYLYGYINDLAADSGGQYPHKNTWNAGFYDGTSVKALGLDTNKINRFLKGHNYSNSYLKGYSYATGIKKAQLAAATKQKNSSDSDNSDAPTNDDSDYTPSDTEASDMANANKGKQKKSTSKKKNTTNDNNDSDIQPSDNNASDGTDNDSSDAQPSDTSSSDTTPSDTSSDADNNDSDVQPSDTTDKKKKNTKSSNQSDQSDQNDNDASDQPSDQNNPSDQSDQNDNSASDQPSDQDTPTYYMGDSQDGSDDAKGIVKKNGANGFNAANDYIHDLESGNINVKNGNTGAYAANSDYINGFKQGLANAKSEYDRTHAAAFKSDGYNYIQSLIANKGISAARRYVHDIQDGSQKPSGLQATQSYLQGCEQALSAYDNLER